MSDFRSFFKDKRVTILGLGLLGRGVGDVEFLAECGAKLVVTDTKSETELRDSVKRVRSRYPDVPFHLGGHTEKDFIDTDMVLKAAGVPLDSPEVAAAKKAGVPVYMSTALFAKFAREAGATIVGVTGTRGKSTVTHMINHSLIRANRRTVLGGNIRGVSTLALLPEVRKGDICVLELDSWQLQGFGDLKISPNVGVFTNLMPDHKNYYGDDMEKYFTDKANIFRFQKKDDTLIAGLTVSDRIRAAVPYMELPQPLPPDWKLRVVGEHNRENASLAAEALRALKLSESDIKSGLESFEAVEGRLQFVREVNGVKVYNDNNATTPEATIAALRSFGDRHNIVLIAGGSDKGLDMRELVAEIGKRCKAAYLLSGTGTEKLAKILLAPVFSSLEEAWSAARSAAAPGDVILFSPAFASFGMFKNEYDRNDQFLRLVSL
jgi:UDP-N-acetylmuramoylalanine--D-glutamate ligase